MHTLKPLDEAAVLAAAAETGAIVTLEEHNVHGGLGSAVADVLALAGAGVPFGKIAAPDRFWHTAGSQAHFRGLAGNPAEMVVRLLRNRLPLPQPGRGNEKDAPHEKAHQHRDALLQRGAQRAGVPRRRAAGLRERAAGLRLRTHLLRQRLEGRHAAHSPRAGGRRPARQGDPELAELRAVPLDVQRHPQHVRRRGALLPAGRSAGPARADPRDGPSLGERLRGGLWRSGPAGRELPDARHSPRLLSTW